MVAGRERKRGRREEKRKRRGEEFFVGIEEYKGNLQVELWRDPLIKSTG